MSSTFDDSIMEGRIEELKQEMRKLPRWAKDTGVTFFKTRFRAQGWMDKSFEPWAKRKKEGKRKGRGILMDRGRLRNSITGQVVADTITFRSDTPYSKIHNEGGTISRKGGERVLAFRTFKNGKRKGKTLFSKNNDKASFAKKVSIGDHAVNMPRRQFMGESAHLNKLVERHIQTTIIKIFK